MTIAKAPRCSGATIMFNFFWERQGNAWLVSRTASRMFAVSAAVIVTLTLILLMAPPDESSLGSRILWGIGGVALALSIFFLWSGMWRFWSRLDRSSQTIRRLWFAILVVGLWFGGVLYYVCVYYPWFRRNSASIPEGQP